MGQNEKKKGVREMAKEDFFAMFSVSSLPTADYLVLKLLYCVMDKMLNAVLM